MNLNLSSISRITVFAIAILFITQISFGQSKDQIELKYKVDSVLIDNTFQYTITVRVRNGNGPFTFYLFQGEPWRGGEVLQESVSMQKATYTFRRVPKSSNYIVAVNGATKNDSNWIYVKP
jgi:hypothetical protein